MNKKKNYQGITTLEQLDEAIARNRALIARKGDRLRRGIRAAQTFYSPSTLMSEGVRRASSSMTFLGVVLSLVTRLRRRAKRK